MGVTRGQIPPPPNFTGVNCDITLWNKWHTHRHTDIHTDRQDKFIYEIYMSHMIKKGSEGVSV